MNTCISTSTIFIVYKMNALAGMFNYTLYKRSKRARECKREQQVFESRKFGKRLQHVQVPVHTSSTLNKK